MNDDERLSKTKVWLGREGETLRAGPLAVGVAFLAAEVVGELDLFISRRPSVFELPKPADNVLTFIHEIPYSLNLAPPIEWVWGLPLEREEGQKADLDKRSHLKESSSAVPVLAVSVSFPLAGKVLRSILSRLIRRPIACFLYYSLFSQSFRSDTLSLPPVCLS